jgi:hypothetical protein
MRLPDFLIIGASKSGTTTLYEYLCRHPQIYMSTPKEPEFFASVNDKNYAKGINWYASLFSQADPHQVCGEASGRYTNWPQFPQAAERVAQVLPHAKLIYIMRHPVDRAYSLYAQIVKYSQLRQPQSKVKKTFEQSIEPGSYSLPGSYLLDSGDYMKQIEQYLRFFPRESFLFLLMEDLAQRPAETLSKVCNFIGVDDEINLIQDDSIAANQASHHAEWFVRSRITAPLKAIPGVASAANWLPQGARDRAYQILKRLPYKQQIEKQYLPPPMLPETRQMLLERFHEPNQRLAEFLNRDLSHWSQ